MAILINHDLLTMPGLLVHQVNSVSRKPKGLSESMFVRFPEADVYKNNVNGLPLGRIIVRGQVVNLVGQKYPGKCIYECREQRLTYFQQGLSELLSFAIRENISTVSFPYLIGCGLAGGNWNDYLSFINQFAQKFPGQTYICKL